MENYCSTISAQAGEALFGTVSQTKFYLLLEYNGSWEEKALAKSSIPEEVKQRLTEVSKNLPGSKVLLIKRGSTPPAGPLHFFLAAAGKNFSRLYRFQLNSYVEILDLDLTAIFQGAPGYQPYLQSDPLYLVCTNGRRDLCCSRFGFPVYEALKKLVGGAAWECTHVGGHRFAANLLHLPQAVLYGRVQPQDTAALVEQIQSGKMRLENLRGRTVYPEVVQAADYFLRQQTGELGLEAFQLVEAVEIEPEHWQVHFRAAKSGEDYNLEVLQEKGEAKVYESCTLDKQTLVKKYIKVS